MDKFDVFWAELLISDDRPVQLLYMNDKTRPNEQLTREASHRSKMEQGRVQQLVSLQNGGTLQSSANLSIPAAKRKGPFDIAPLQSGGTP